jgi:hypothetical protein
MRPLVLKCALALLHAVPVGAWAVSVAEERPLSAGQALHLRVDAGSVQVRLGEAGKVRVEAELAPGQRVGWRESSDRAALIVDDPERFSPRPVSLRVAVPSAARLVIHLGRGTLDLQGVEAERLVVRGGAEVRVAGTFEAVDIAVDGPVDLRLDDPSGTVRAEGTEVSVVARGVSGDVVVDARRGAVTLSLDRPRRVRAMSVSGPISLRLGEASAADVLLDSLSGDLRVDLVDAWPGVVVPRLGRGELNVAAEIAPRIVPPEKAASDGGRLVLRSTFGNAWIAASAPLEARGSATGAVPTE